MRVRAVTWECGEGQTDTQTRGTQYISRLRLTRNVMSWMVYVSGSLVKYKKQPRSALPFHSCGAHGCFLLTLSKKVSEQCELL